MYKESKLYKQKWWTNKKSSDIHFFLSCMNQCYGLLPFLPCFRWPLDMWDCFWINRTQVEHTLFQSNKCTCWKRMYTTPLAVFDYHTFLPSWWPRDWKVFVCAVHPGEIAPALSLFIQLVQIQRLVGSLTLRRCTPPSWVPYSCTPRTQLQVQHLQMQQFWYSVLFYCALETQWGHVWYRDARLWPSVCN